VIDASISHTVYKELVVHIKRRCGPTDEGGSLLSFLALAGICCRLAVRLAFFRLRGECLFHDSVSVHKL
jgi:hypothetical protein